VTGLMELGFLFLLLPPSYRRPRKLSPSNPSVINQLAFVVNSDVWDTQLLLISVPWIHLTAVAIRHRRVRIDILQLFPYG
jgi:hypothetical protein